MRFRIVTEPDEYPDGVHAKVIDVDTGEVVPGVSKAEWSCTAGGVAKCVLWMSGVEIDAEGEYKTYETTALGYRYVSREGNGGKYEESGEDTVRDASGIKGKRSGNDSKAR